MGQELHEQGENRPIPRILFTGTNLEYAQEVIKTHGAYRQEVSAPNYLSPRLGVAFDAAINRSHTYKGTPVVIMIDSQVNGVNPRWNSRTGFRNDILSDQIPADAIIGAYKVELQKRGEILLADNPIEALRQNCQEVDLKSVT